MDRHALTGSRLARKLTIYIVFLGLFVALVSTAIQLYLSYRQNIREISDDFALIEVSYLSSLVDNIWVYNDKQIGIQLDGMLGLPGIEYVYINIGGQTAWSSGAIKSDSTIEKKFDLIYREGDRHEPLGTLFVIAGLDHVYNELLAGTRVALVISVVAVFLFAGAILLIFRNLVTRHMTTVAHFVNTIDIEQEGATLRLNRPSPPGKKADELDHVVDAINNMRRDLLKSIVDLRISEERMRTVFEAADNVAFVTTDIGGEDTLVLGFSPGAEKIFGYTAEEILGQRVAILHPPDMVKDFPAIQNALREERKGHTGETTLVRKSGDRFPALFTIHALCDGSGAMTGTLGISIDITERKQAEEELQKHREHLEKLVKDRTFELEEKNAELERMNDVFVGREFRIKELRDRVKELELTIDD